MDDKININLQMAGITYTMKIDRSDEELVRKAAKQVDLRLNTYLQRYSGIGVEKVLPMVAYQYALENLQFSKVNDTKPYTDKVKDLSKLLEDYLEDNREK